MALNLTNIKEAINAKYATEIGDDDKVELLLQDNGTTFYDASLNRVDVVGDYAKLSATQAKWGTHSIEYTAGNGYIDLPTVDFAFGTGDFTVEFWMYGDQQDGNIINPISSTGVGYWAILIQTGKLRWNDAYATTNLLETTVDVTAASWKHFAFVRSSGTLTVYVDGTANVSIADTSNYVNSDARIGNGNVGQLADIYFDDIRVTKGKALYTSNFTAPTSQFTISSDLKLLNIRNQVQVDENVLSYASINDFPTASPTNAGEIIKTGNNYYLSSGSNWDAFALVDSAVDQLPRARYQGENNGYIHGGWAVSSPLIGTEMDKFPFSSTTWVSINSTGIPSYDHANISNREYIVQHGQGNPTTTEQLYKYTFSSETGSFLQTSHPTLELNYGASGNSSLTDGSGFFQSVSPPSGANYAKLWKFAFGSETAITEWLDLDASPSVDPFAGLSRTSSIPDYQNNRGFHWGGYRKPAVHPPANANISWYYPMNSTTPVANFVPVGTHTGAALLRTASVASDTHSYNYGGQIPITSTATSPGITVKMSFSSLTPVSEIPPGIGVQRWGAGANSNVSYGYITAGRSGPVTYSETLSINYSNDNFTGSVSNLTTARSYLQNSGTQY